MSLQVMKHVHFLSLLASADDKQRVVMMKTMNDQQLKVLVECVYNILFGVIPLSPQYKKKISTHKNAIRQITEQDISRERRKRLLLKHRTILPTLLKVVLTHLKG